MPQDFCAQFRGAGVDMPVIYEAAVNQSPEESLDHVGRCLLGRLPVSNKNHRPIAGCT